MNLSHSTRKGMLHTVKGMLEKLEEECQAQYKSIEYHQEHIKRAQDTLVTLEQEYLNCKELIKEMESKINA
jgi:chromosome segregation ATPase